MGTGAVAFQVDYKLRKGDLGTGVVCTPDQQTYSQSSDHYQWNYGHLKIMAAMNRSHAELEHHQNHDQILGQICNGSFL